MMITKTGRCLFKSFAKHFAATTLPAVLLSALCFQLALPGHSCAAETEMARQSVTQKNLAIDFWLDSHKAANSAIVAGDFVDVRFRVKDALTGQPVSPLQPGVWIDRVKTTRDDASCQGRIKRYLQGGISFQADIDLNKYFILVLNNDHTISVIDPILGVNGYTQLYAMVRLAGRGEDWAHGADDKYLWVTLPEADKVALVDLEQFETIRHLDTAANPGKINLQPDGHYLWVGHHGTNGEFSGVTIIDPGQQAVVKTITTGAGNHNIAFSPDSLYAYITNGQAGTLSIIDTQTLQKVKDIDVGLSPVAVAFDRLSNRIVVAAGTSGELLFVNPEERRVEKRVQTKPGLTGYWISPDDRWGFALNSRSNRLDIYDSRQEKIVQTLAVGQQPHLVSFTDNYAYIRSLGIPEIGLIKLSELDQATPPRPQMVPFGNIAPGARTSRVGSVGASPSLAPSISPTGEWGAVVAANQAETTIYYYMEGMVAPMGTFPTYGRIPRALTIVDRSIKEYEKGVYGARIRVPESGDYNVAFVLDTPWIDHCFSFSATANPLDKTDRNAKQVRIKTLSKERSLSIGKETLLDFQLTEPTLNALQEQQRVIVQLSQVPGKRQQRQEAEWLGDGHYRVRLNAQDSGYYYLFFAIPSLGLDVTEVPYLVFRAQQPAATPPES